MGFFTVFLLGVCRIGGSALENRRTFRGSASLFVGEESASRTEHERCVDGLYAELDTKGDDAWRPFNVLESEGVAVYVQFSKVGSSTMRDSVIEAWHATYMPDTCFPPSRRWRESGRKGLIGLDKHTLIQGRFGVCDHADTREHFEAIGKTCSYYTLLRDPIDTAISMYTYFCQHCAEDGRACVNPNMASPSGDRCPNMSLVDFTRLNGNEYVKEFSGAYGCADCDVDGEGEPQYEENGLLMCRPFEEACGALHSTSGGFSEDSHEMLERAKANMEREVIPLTLDELFDTDGKHPTGAEVLSMVYGITNLTRHHSTHVYSDEGHYEASEDELAEVRRILAPDMALYGFAKELFHKNGKRLLSQGLAPDALTKAGTGKLDA